MLPLSVSMADTQTSTLKPTQAPETVGSTAGSAGSTGSTPDKTGNRSTVARDVSKSKEKGRVMNGRAATGMYPQVSRTKLSEVTGKDITTISQIMRGRIRPRLEDAIVIAASVGIAIEIFNADWKRQRKLFEKDQAGKGKGRGKKKRKTMKK